MFKFAQVCNLLCTFITVAFIGLYINSLIRYTGTSIYIVSIWATLCDGYI